MALIKLLAIATLSLFLGIYGRAQDNPSPESSNSKGRSPSSDAWGKSGKSRKPGNSRASKSHNFQKARHPASRRSAAKRTAKHQKSQTRHVDATHKFRDTRFDHVPQGVATTLPTKRSVASTIASPTSRSGGGATFAPTSVAPISDSAVSVVVAVVSPSKALGFHAAIDFTSEAPANLSVTSITPRLIYDLGEKVALYGQGEFNSYSSASGSASSFLGASVFSTVNRPEFGGSISIFDSDVFLLDAALGVRLPFFNFLSSTPLSIDSMNVWGIEPGISMGVRIFDGDTHLLGAAKIIYDSTNANAVDSLNRPLSSSMTLGMDHQWGIVTIGLAYHSLDWLGSGTFTTNGSSAVVSPLDVSHGELFGSVRLGSSTAAHFSATAGIKTQYDDRTYVLYDSPLDVASSSITVGLSHVF